MVHYFYVGSNSFKVIF